MRLFYVDTAFALPLVVAIWLSVIVGKGIIRGYRKIKSAFFEEKPQKKISKENI